jgi:putrescine transport system substrate-binding protein
MKMKIKSLVSGLALLAAMATASLAGEVRLFSWEAYFGAGSIKKFEAETNNTVTYDVFDSNDTVETRILAGNSGYDVVTPNLSPHLARQIPLNAWGELDKAQLPNIGNLDPELVAKVGEADPGNVHALPWMWGTTGVGHNEEKIKEVMADAPVDSWKMIFDPEVAVKFKDCGISVLDDAEQVLGSALIYLGLDPDTDDPAVLEKAVELITKVRPFIRQFHGSNYIAGLAAGDLCVAMGYSGDMQVATNRAREAGNKFVISYRLPKEGNLVWFDTLAIPADAPNRDGALAFINFVMKPEIAAAAANETGFATANKVALALVDEKIRGNPNYYPSAEAQRKFHLPKVKDEKSDKMWQRAWNRAKGIE